MKKMTIGFALLLCLLLVFTAGLCQQISGSVLRAELPYELGDTSDVIRDIREALLLIRGMHVEQQKQDEGDGELFSAEYDEPLQRVVRKYQRQQGLPETGIVDEATMDRLLPRYYERIDAALSGALVYGTMSEAVRTMQENLKALGYYNGDITGNFGEITEGGVMAFQEANGLTVNGFAGEETLAVIESKVQTLGGE